MGAKRVALWPVARLSRWIDDQPLRAVGALVSVGAFVVLLASVGVEMDPNAPTLVYEGVTLDAVRSIVVAQPAYAVAVVFGALLFVFYDG